MELDSTVGAYKLLSSPVRPSDSIAVAQGSGHGMSQLGTKLSVDSERELIEALQGQQVGPAVHRSQRVVPLSCLLAFLSTTPRMQLKTG